jgi:hypothetical protein
VTEESSLTRNATPESNDSRFGSSSNPHHLNNRHSGDVFISRNNEDRKCVFFRFSEGIIDKVRIFASTVHYYVLDFVSGMPTRGIYF